MNSKPLNNKGMSILVIILIVAVISGIAGAVYLLTLNKSMPSNPENKTATNLENKDNDSSEIKCEEDFYGCELFKTYNNIRKAKGLSPVEHDSNLCFIAKDMAKNINKISKDIKIELPIFYRDRKFDKYKGERDEQDELKDWVYINYNSKRYSVLKDSTEKLKKGLITETAGMGLDIVTPYDRGCFRFSENENNQITLMTVLGRRKL